MTTLAQVQTAVVNLNGQMDGLLNTAIDGLNPNKVTTPKIIALLTSTQTQVNAVLNDAIAKAQALGVL